MVPFPHSLTLGLRLPQVNFKPILDASLVKEKRFLGEQLLPTGSRKGGFPEFGLPMRGFLGGLLPHLGSSERGSRRDGLSLEMEVTESSTGHVGG